MKTPGILAILVCVVALAGAVTRAQSGPDLFQKALVRERTEGNLEEAIALYRQVVTQAGSDRALAARALVQIGQCYEKLGNAEAQKAYQQVVRDFTDQAEQAALARARLAALAVGTADSLGIVTRQVWTGPDTDFSGTPSPDGRYLSYSDRSGNLAILELATHGSRQLTTDASLWSAQGWAGFSLFSPDGRQVAYEWGQWGSELRLAALDGSKPRVLLPSKRDWWIVPCDWSLDGRHILVHYYRAGERGPSQMAVVTVADGSLRVVKELNPRHPRNRRNMWFSPDGRYILYDFLAGDDRNVRDLAVVSIDGELDVPLVGDPADDYALGWLPDGRSIAFASNRSGAYGIWTIPVSNGRPDGAPRLARRDAGPIRPLGFTRHGVLFYAQTGSMTVMDTDILAANLDLDQGAIDEPRLAVRNHIGLNMLPEWSPDGRYLAYVSGRPDSRSYVLSVRDETTGELRELPSELVRVESIRWSPDGSSLLVQGGNTEQRVGLFAIDARTGSMRPLQMQGSDTAALIDAQWLADGRGIVYVTNRRRPQVASSIVVLNPETGSHEEILHLTDQSLIGFLAVSPDGKTLAFTAFRLDGGTDGGAPTDVALMVMPSSGGSPTEVFHLKFPELAGSLAWCPDSASILFARSSVGAQEAVVWQISRAGGASRAIGVAPGLGVRTRLSVHPDGRRLVYTRYARRIEIWTAANLGASLERR
jgi:Tol biopolymer transport system component